MPPMQPPDRSPAGRSGNDTMFGLASRRFASAVSWRRLGVIALWGILLCLCQRSSIVAQIRDGQPSRENDQSAAVSPAETSSSLTVTLLTGGQVVGRPLSLTPDILELQTDQGRQQWKTKSIARIETPHPPIADSIATAFQFRGGTRLQLRSFQSDRESLTGVPAHIQEPQEFPGDQVDWFRRATTSAPLWKEVLSSAASDSDAVVVQKGERLDWLDGIVRSYSDQEIAFRFQGRQVAVPFEKIAGLVFFHPPTESSTADTSVLEDIYHQRWMVARWEASPQWVQLTTTEGLSARLSWSEIQSWNFSALRFLALSGRMPDQFDWQPLVPLTGVTGTLSRWNAPRLNVSFDGQPIRLAERPDPESASSSPRQELMQWLTYENDESTDQKWNEYREGLALKLGSRATYQLTDSFQRITGLVGLAQPLARNQAAVVTILADQQVVYRETLTADRQPTLEIDVPIQQPARLTINVTPDDRQTPCDVVHFANLRLLK